MFGSGNASGSAQNAAAKVDVAMNGIEFAGHVAILLVAGCGIVYAIGGIVLSIVFRNTNRLT